MNEGNEPAGVMPGTPAPNAGSPAPRSEEVEATTWIFHRVAEGRQLPVAEAECVVNAMYGEHNWGGRLFFPLLPVSEPTEFMAVHAVNVATLAMALAGLQQFDAASVRRVGVAALLHDIGMAKVPVSTWGKAGSLTPEERSQVMAHPTDGATLLLAAHASLDLAAVVAYEHHLRVDGSGYPKLTYPRSAHFVSRLVQVCDVFCALSADRPYRKAWPLEVILSFLDERSGFEFHPTIATALTRLVRDDVTVAAL
jgi:HD-GYP domain-containing protein (c-di-GMP phosphodiesterase class II)